jgi:hypothetical protein
LLFIIIKIINKYYNLNRFLYLILLKKNKEKKNNFFFQNKK